MNAQRCQFVALLAAGISFGCSGEPPETEPLGRIRQELDVCNETVPDEHWIDGIPAYAQCDETTGAIWSNNGVDTSTTSLGSDWVRTQYSGGYQCTELAYRYLYFRWDIDYRGGNGGEWCDGNLPATLVANSTPVHGDLIVFAPGSCGADPVYGHIAVVDTVNEADAEVTFVEQNRANRRTCAIDTANCFLHVVANDGQTGTGGAGGEGGTSAGGGSGGSLVPTCTDGVLNQDETSIDCGGSVCPSCTDGAPCLVATDCTSGICANGTCGCIAGLTACAGVCVDVSADPANCGACGYPCAADTVCNLGVCGLSCVAGLTPCDQECVDTTSDLDHCGGCNVACDLPGAFTACVGGTCTLSSCQAGAVDLDQDPTNGCEYACVVTGAETCNGADDDCNGVIDDAPACDGTGGTGGVPVIPAVGGSPAVGTGGASVPVGLGGAPSGGAAAVGSGGTGVGTGGTDASSGFGGAQTGGAPFTGGLDAGGSGPAPSTHDSADEDSGCGCFVAGTRQRTSPSLGLLLGALLVLRRRRVRRTA